jgi:ACS family allantoate permease-like MFS transporter
MDLLRHPADSSFLAQSAPHELTDSQDKTSISTQALYGLREDTGLKGNEYAMLTTSFYLCYCVSELPSTWALQRLNMGKGLSVYMIFWGCMVIAVGLAKNYTQLVTFRSLQGVFESTISPGFRESR